MNSRFCLIFLILIAIVGPSSYAAPVPPQTLRWANRLLAYANRPVSQWSGDYTMQYAAADALGAFIAASQKYDDDARIHVGIAKSQILLGQYEDAARNYGYAIRLSPKDKSLKNALAAAELQAEIAELALKKLPQNHLVISAQRYPDKRDNAWFVLSAIAERLDPQSLRRYDYRDIRLTAFRHLNGQTQQIWQTDELGHQGFNEANLLMLGLEDITGDGKPEVIVPAVIIGASWMPSHLAVFGWDNGKVNKLLGVSSDEQLMFSDIDRDGRLEVSNDHAIGWTLSHAGQPRWVDIYASKNGVYRLADSDYPWRYCALAAEIKRALEVAPNDWELLKYQGRIYQIERRPSLALRYYKRALRMAKITLRDYTYSNISPRMNYEINYIEQRIKSLQRKN